MSDLSVNEIEDIAWDDFCQSEDHIVPHPGFDRDDDPSIKREARSEVTSASNSTGDRSTLVYAAQQKDQKGFSTPSKTRTIILEQESWSPAPNGAVASPSGSNFVKQASSLASDNTRASGYKMNSTGSYRAELRENDSLPTDKSTAVDNCSFSYPHGDITQTNNGIDFFENSEEKDPSDFLYYGWPAIENLDDVDRMFRNCDSTFGLGSKKEDDLGWLSLSDDIGGSGDMLKTDFKFPRPEADVLDDILIKNDSKKRSAITDDRDVHTPKDYVSEIRLKGKIQHKYLADSHLNTGNDGMIDDHKEQMKLQNKVDGKRKKQCFGNVSFNYVIDQPNEVMQLPGAIFHPFFPSVHNQQQHQTLRPDFHNYLQNTISFVHSDKRLLLHQTSVEPKPSIKSETKDIMYPSPRESSQSSSQLQSLDSSPSIYVASDEGSEKKEKLQNLQGICSSNVHECSTMSSGVDDISLEAAILRQLQLVTERLDLRTKLCIRDSLYRLARSAEQRHNHINQNGVSWDEIDATGAFNTDGTKFTGFMGMETDTNPIDRSIAHLLFHQPADTSALVNHDSFLIKLQGKRNQVHNSTSSPTIMVDKLSESEKQGSDC